MPPSADRREDLIRAEFVARSKRHTEESVKFPAQEVDGEWITGQKSASRERDAVDHRQCPDLLEARLNEALGADAFACSVSAVCQ
jgi:hypothetical protein